MMDTMTFTTSSAHSFPKRIRSVSARLFSINTNNDHPSNKRISCPSSSDNILNPSKWFPRIRCRSSSSASSTFSIVFSSNTTVIDTPFVMDHQEHNEQTSAISLEIASSELENLYKDAKEEIEYAIESQGSIYYEGDKVTAHAAFELCETKYGTVMQLLGDTTNAIKFRFRWQADLDQLRSRLNSLPPVIHSIYE